MVERKKILIYGFVLLVVSSMELPLNYFQIVPQTNRWFKCFENVFEDNHHLTKDEYDKKIALCRDDLSHFPIFYSIWSFQYMIFYLVMVTFKRNEDYIARYSQD